MGARAYDPSDGLFFSRDPLGLGLYTYAGDNPISFRDPSGMLPEYDENVAAALTFVFGDQNAAEPLVNPEPVSPSNEAGSSLTTAVPTAAPMNAEAGVPASALPAQGATPESSATANGPASGTEGQAGQGATADHGPGSYETVNHAMSDRAAAYQEQVTGQDARTKAYFVNGQEYDGYDNGELQEAKGPGYAKNLGTPWFQGEQQMLDQAARQLQNAGNVPLTWYFAEPEAASYMQRSFQNNDLGAIRVVYQPVDE